LTLNQLLHRSFRASWADIPKEGADAFRDALASSALYRATTNTGRCQHPIGNRIRNCVLVAQHICSNHSSAHEQELLKVFCTAASTSRCCWDYVLSLRYNTDRFVYHVDKKRVFLKEGDILLEAALLVANGYDLADAKHWLLRLGKLGMLVGYRNDTVHIDRLDMGCSIRGTVTDVQVDICSLGGSSYQDLEEAEIGMAISGKYDFEREADEELEVLERELCEEGCRVLPYS
jgi:hypothetical protein